MLGLPVTYYVFTDMPERMPDIKLAPQRSIKIIKVERHSRWQDISMMRMKSISDVIESDIRHNFTHVLCFDVDQVFTGRFGSEALGDSVALLHAYYYRCFKWDYLRLCEGTGNVKVTSHHVALWGVGAIF